MGSLGALVLFCCVRKGRGGLSLRDMVRGAGLGVGMMQFRLVRLPCPALTQFKLARRVVRSLPVHILSRVYSNERSPILPIHIHSRGKRLVRDHDHFTLIHESSNLSSIMFCPILRSSPLRHCSRTRRGRLLTNGTVLTSIRATSKQRDGTFIRVSRRAGRIVCVPAPVVKHGLRILTSVVRLNAVRMGDVRGNRPLALIISSRPIAINVSLRSGANVHFYSNSDRG